LKICFLVDARSPIAQNWISYFIKREHDVTVISSFPCTQGVIAGARLYEVPVALSGFSGTSQTSKAKAASAGSSRTLIASLRSRAMAKLSLAAYHWILPFDVRRHVEEVQKILRRTSPDVVHAMRIPFEGILAAKATPGETPLLISVWGNDFTLWAARNLVIGRQTRQSLERADGLHTDCQRDLSLAINSWGFDSRKPALLVPGAGGIDGSKFHPGEPDSNLRAALNIPADAPVIINPRGFRGYVRNDIFFQAIPAVLREQPGAVFICTGMEANSVAENWMSQLAIRDSVRLLPPVPHNQMGDLFRLARVAVSPSMHDGTPNTLLEAMACGCLPVAFDIESVREWISDQSNGLLCKPDAGSLARAVVRALTDGKLRDEARRHNSKLIAERAEHHNVLQRAESFYFELIRRKRDRAEV
jgi:glycosyltransferase involved in cell wall biosynthesis